MSKDKDDCTYYVVVTPNSYIIDLGEANSGNDTSDSDTSDSDKNESSSD